MHTDKLNTNRRIWKYPALPMCIPDHNVAPFLEMKMHPRERIISLRVCFPVRKEYRLIFAACSNRQALQPGWTRDLNKYFGHMALKKTHRHFPYTTLPKKSLFRENL